MLQLTETCYGEFSGNKFKIGSSATSYFIPIINCSRVGSQHQRIYEGDFIIYNRPALNRNSSRKFNLKNFLEMINKSAGLYSFDLGTGEKRIIIHVAKGYIVNEKDELLMVMTTKPDRLSLQYQSEYSNVSIPKENAKHLTLLISTELLTNPIYSNFYKKLEKEYILDAYKVEIPVVFTTTSKIEKLTYSNEFELKFNTVDELQNHLRDNVGNIMFKSNEQFKTFNPGIGSKIEDRQRKFVPVKTDEVIWEEGIIIDEPTTRRRTVINLIDDTEEPQVEDLPF